MKTNNQLKSHDYPEVYKGLGINLSKLGCVMLDLDPISIDHWIGQDGQSSYTLGFPFHKSTNKDRFWIDGYVAGKTPHITLLYGLLETAKNYQWHIEQVLKGWKMDSVEIDHFGYFNSPYPDEEYYCIVAHIKVTPELIEGHQRLEFLPHVNTFAGYKPHFTIAYIKKDDVLRDNFIADLTREFSGKKLKIKEGVNYGGDK